MHVGIAAAALFLMGCGLSFDVGPPDPQAAPLPDAGSRTDAATCVPLDETCNAMDDDCDGAIDEDLGEVSCGVGACNVATPACVDGQAVACVPSDPIAEACNGVDDDCDGSVDNDCECERYVLLGAAGTGTTVVDPMGSIADAIDSIADAPATVCVAAQAPGGDCRRTVYADRFVTMREGVTVVGGFHGTTFEGGDSSCNTVIAPPRSPAVVFPAGLTNDTVLSTVSVQSPDADEQSVGIHVQSGGTLHQLNVRAGTAPISVGLVVGGDSGERAAPEIEGGTVSGGRGDERSAAIAVLNAEPAIHGMRQILGGRANELSFGIFVENGGGTRIENNVLVDTMESGSTAGIALIGNVSDVIIQNNTTIRAGHAHKGNSFGIEAACTEGEFLVADNALIAGGAVERGSQGVGVFTHGCSARVRNNSLIRGRSGGEQGAGTGVLCTGGETACELANNTLVGLPTTAAGDRAVAVAIDDNATAEIHKNVVLGCQNPLDACIGVSVTNAQVTMDGNTILPSRGIAQSVGIFAHGAQARLTNNRVALHRGGVGLWTRIEPADEMRQLDVHSNTFTAVADESAGRVDEVTLVKIQHPKATEPTSTGVFRNNLFHCAPGIRQVAFEEVGARARLLQHSMFHGCTEAFLSQVDGIVLRPVDLPLLESLRPRAVGNFTGNPDFERNFHLGPASGAIDTGTAEGAPPLDVDGDMRPSPADGRHDIGWDER